MGLRFRRSIRIAPGIRINLSARGASLTVGPRGASINFGSRGTFLNTGIRGTGLYSRERLGRQAPHAASFRSTVSEPPTQELSLALKSDGSLSIRDRSGTEITEPSLTRIKRQCAGEIHTFLKHSRDQVNRQVATLDRVHLGTPAPTDTPIYKQEFFSEPAPARRSNVRLSLLDRIISSRREKVELENSKIEQEYQDDVRQWEAEKASFEDAERLRCAQLETGIYTNPESMTGYIEQQINAIDWPRETEVSTEISKDGHRVFLDVDVPELEEMPTQTASLPQRGLRLSFKEMSATQRRLLYTRYIHGAGFRLIGEALRSLPVAQQVVLSAYCQMMDPGTGRKQDKYVYSVRVERQSWGQIDFANLAAVDPTEALARFDLRRDMTKTGLLRPIEPFTP